MPLTYLKSRIQTNIPAIVTLHKRLAPKDETDYNTKEPTGKKNYPYVLIMEDMEEVWHYAKEYEEDVLKLFNVGDKLQIVRQEKTGKDGKPYKLFIWTPPEGAEARSAADPQPPNTQETKHQEVRVDRESAQKIKEVMISLAGLMQAHIKAGKDNVTALLEAKEARRMLLEAAIDEATS